MASREEKATAVAEIGEQLEASSAVFAVDYRGISVPQAAELRTRLREADASFTVVKNRLAKRATEDAGATDLDEHLVGPTALTFVRGDAVLAAKAVSDFIRTTGVLAYKGGMMDGAALGPDQFVSIARLPGVDVLRGQLVGLAASPLTGIVRTLNQLIAGMASQLGQIAEKGLVSGEAPTAPAEEAPDAEEAEIAEAPGTQEAGDEAAEEADSADTTPEANAPAGPDEPAVDAEPPDESDDAGAPEQTQDSESDTKPEETPSADDAGSEDEKKEN